MRIFFVALVLTFGFTAPALSIPPSPAGGGYLTIYEAGDYAFVPYRLDFDFKLGKNGFTVELWFYLKRPVKEFNKATGEAGESWALVYKAESYSLALISYGVRVRIEGPGAIQSWGFLISRTSPTPINQWHYIAIMFDEQYLQEVANDFLKGNLGGFRGFVNTPSPLCIGGAQHRLVGIDRGQGEGGKGPPSTSFIEGLIDEVRISNIVRYPRENLNQHFWEDTIQVPNARFEPDEHTVVLWHFDGWGQEERLMDSSGNGHHLTYHGKYLDVHPRGKLATTWGEIKRR